MAKQRRDDNDKHPKLKIPQKIVFGQELISISFRPPKEWPYAQAWMSTRQTTVSIENVVFVNQLTAWTK